MQSILTRSDDLVGAGGLDQLTAPSLEDILHDPESRKLADQQRFSIIMDWAVGLEGNKGQSSQERLQAARKLTRHVRLERIDPTYLSTTVADSELVSEAQLLEAFKLQALAAKAHPLSFDLLLGKQPTWKSRRDRSPRKTLDMLPVGDGVLRWSIQVEKNCSYFWIGIEEASSGQLYAYTVRGAGHVSCWEGKVESVRDELDEAKFKTGSTIEFVLNLTRDDDQNGSLSAAVDDGSATTIFSDLLAQNKRFLPAHCIGDGGSIRLLSIEKA